MKNFFLPCLILFTFNLHVFAQSKGVYTDHVASTSIPASSGAGSYTLSDLSSILPSLTTLNKKVSSAKAEVWTDFGGDYHFGKATTLTAFNLKVSFKLSGYAGSASAFSKDYSFIIDNNHPEGYVLKDLISRAVDPGSLTQSGLDIDRIQVSDITITDLQSGGSYSQAISKLKVHVSYEIKYGLDVRTNGSEIALTKPTLAPGSLKAAIFNWSTTFPYPNYQIQVLRLFNIDPANKTDNVIKAQIDWTKAVTIETENSLKQLKFTIAEGTGFYVWRIRPVGTYFDAGIANNSNWGLWSSNAPQNATMVTLPDPSPAYFFFLDPDDNKNYIYSRTFTEENKIKESISYANSLLQEKQSQVYMPSSNKTITTQSITDHVGRPSLKTAPVPVNGELNGYKENFAKSGGELYQDKHFDNDNNVNNPAQIDNTSPAGTYYNGQNSIPNAQGYPYQRVIFYNDGTGRIKEQSGIGKDQMVGDKTSGRGKTVKTYYSTAAEDELVALFGSEAPNSESVQKIITVDQNNVASITYKGKDGKVIATALSFLEEGNSNLLPIGNPNSINVSDKLSGGVLTGDAYVSSKRISFTEATTFVPEYRIEHHKFEQLCGDISLNCGYVLKVIIHNLNDPTKDIVLTKDMKNMAFEDVMENGIKKSYIFVRSSDWGVSMPINLPAGDYMIEKKLISSGNVEAEVINQEEKISEQLGPLKNWIIGSLQAISCPEQLDLFYHNLVDLSLRISSHVPLTSSYTFSCTDCQGSISFSEKFLESYNNPLYASQYTMKVYDVSGNPITSGAYIENPKTVLITTPCCVNIKVDVGYHPPFKCPPTNMYTLTLTDKRPSNLGGDNLKLDVNYDFLTHPEWTEYFPDFEGYALSMLMSCQNRSLADAKTIFYSYVPGWKEGELNMMVYHMLTDVYSCDGKGNNAPSTPGENDEKPVAPDPCTPASVSMVPGTQYQCSDISKCWTSLVMMLSQSYCPDPNLSLDDLNQGGNVSNTFDNETDGGSTHDNIFDGIKLPGIIKMFAEALLSKKIRNMQDASGADALPDNQKPKFTFHMVDLLLQCTGYKFADILEPNPDMCTTPDCVENGTLGPYLADVAYDFDNNLLNGEYISSTYKNSGWVNTPVEFDNNFQPKAGSRTIKELFPNIYNPIYAFKYFEYKTETFPILEKMTCFRDPNDCFEVVDGNKVTKPCCLDANNDPNNPFCVKDYDHPHPDQDLNTTRPYKLLVKNFCGTGKIICPFTKPDWNCAQRVSYFYMLKSYKPMPIPPVPDPTINCNWLTTPRQWYLLPDEYKYRTNKTYVSREQFLQYADNHTPEQLNVDPSVPAGLLAINGKTDPILTTNKEVIPYVEIMAIKERTGCQNRCEQRKQEFRTAVMQMFTDRCYVFDGCKLTEDDNIVYMEDVDKIVEALTVQCRLQCNITTYTCETVQCRDYAVSDYYKGWTEENTTLVLGAGGKPGDASDCPAGVGELKPCCQSQPLGGNLDGNNVTVNALDCNSPYNLSYFEYTNVNQAKEWLIKLDIKSMCNSMGAYVDADQDGRRDNYETYYFKAEKSGNKILVLQDQRMNSNTGDVCPPAPTGTTFVPKDTYELPTTTITDINKPGVKVESPKVGIQIVGQ